MGKPITPSPIQAILLMLHRFVIPKPIQWRPDRPLLDPAFTGMTQSELAEYAKLDGRDSAAMTKLRVR